jgi:Family of unknown function (DUF6599)
MFALALAWLSLWAGDDVPPPAPVEADSLASYFPSSNAIDHWRRLDSLRVFRGNELYLLIDGGADIYLEYGFSRVGALHFVNGRMGQAALEIYEMNDPISAYGIFSYLAAGTGKPASIGQSGIGGEDFVIAWKGRYVVSVTALDEGGRGELIDLARAVDLKMKAEGGRPPLVDVLLAPDFAHREVVYLRGPLSFDRQPGPGHGHVFRFLEGSSGTRGACQSFVLRYATPAGRDSAQRGALRALTGEAGYAEESATGSTHLLGNHWGEYLFAQGVGSYLLLVSGKDKKEVQDCGKGLKDAASWEGR